jgi:hypothetical protein
VQGDNAEGTRLLALARCLVACRHIDEQTCCEVAPRLQKLTENMITNVIFNPKASESIETIQALLILAVWPGSYIKGGARDGKLLITTAISMALDLKLQEASVKAIELRNPEIVSNKSDIGAMGVKAQVVSSQFNAQ